MPTETDISTMLQRYARGLALHLEVDEPAVVTIDLHEDQPPPGHLRRSRLLAVSAIAVFVVAVVGLVTFNREPARVEGGWASVPAAPLEAMLAWSEATWTGSEFVVLGLEPLSMSPTTTTTWAASYPGANPGSDQPVVATYDPASEQWTRLPSPPNLSSTARLVAGGPGPITVLYGGYGADCVRSDDPTLPVGVWWDASSSSWQVLERPSIGLFDLGTCGGMATRADGTVFLFGSDADTPGDLSSGAYDETGGTWRRTANAPYYFDGLVPVGDSIYGLRFELDPNGMAIRGDVGPEGRHAGRYDIATDTWTELPTPPVNPKQALAAGSQLFVWDEQAGALFDPATGEWTKTPTIPNGSHRYAHLGFIEGRVAVVGGVKPDTTGTRFGYDPVEDNNSGSVLDLATMQWARIVSLPPSVRGQGGSSASSPHGLFIYGAGDRRSPRTDGAILEF